MCMFYVALVQYVVGRHEDYYTDTGVCKLLELLGNKSLMGILALCSHCWTKDLHFLQLQKI